MKPNTDVEMISHEGTKIPFVFQGLGFFLMTEAARDGDFDKETENPRDISHLSKRNYGYLSYPFQINCGSGEGPNSGSVRKNLYFHQTASVSPDGHSLPLGEVVELSDDECVTHYNRLLGGDFPWERLNILALAGLEQKDMDADDFKEWQQMYDLHSRFREGKTQDTGNIEQKRLTVHDLLLWTLVLDYLFDVPESEGELGSGLGRG